VSQEPIGPVEALERIAYLMERVRAETPKVKAFRKAAATVRTMTSEELAERVRAGSLTALPGIGASTGRVITQAVNGERPERLVELEADAGPLATGGEELRELLRGDLHSHSDWSDGGSPIEEMARTARDVIGHDYLVLTDHSPRLTVANGLSVERLRQQLDVVAALNEDLAPFRLLTGIEVDILDDGSLDQTEEMLDRLDVVVASVHSKLRMPSPDMTKRMVAAVNNPHVDVLGHCTGRLITGSRGTRPESQFDAEAVFTACRENGVAVEINSRPERSDPPGPLLELAVEIGCIFSIDTDAHAPGQLEFQAYGCSRAAEHGVPANRIVNALLADDLLAWAGRAG
jgi:putative hydrolase